MVERLSGHWDVWATDLRGNDAVVALDVTDVQACREQFADVDAVLHLVAVPDPDASWDELLPSNVVGAYCVAAAAMAMGVRRLVLASSLQAVSGYRDDTQVRWVAATSSVEVVAVRIGNYLDQAPAGPDVTPRDRAAWLSPADCAQLMRAAVEGPVDGLVVVNGVSANRYRKAEYGSAERRLGYQPRDDAWAQS